MKYFVIIVINKGFFMINKEINYQNIIQDLDTIAKLEEGQKLCVHNQTGRLEYSYGSSQSGWGWLVQTVDRNVSKRFGNYLSEWKDVSDQIDCLAENMEKLLEENALNPQQIETLKERATLAIKKIDAMADREYASSITANQKFHGISEKLTTIVCREVFPEQVDEDKEFLLLNSSSLPNQSANFTGTAFAALSKQEDEFYENFKIVKEDQSLNTSFTILSMDENSQVKPNQHDLSVIDEQSLSIAKKTQDNFMVELNGWVFTESDDAVKTQELKNLAHPLFDLEEALSFSKKISQEFRAPIISATTERLQKMQIIQKILDEIEIQDNEPLVEQKRKLVSDLIALALYPPLLENGQTLSMLSFDKTLDCLTKITNIEQLKTFPDYFHGNYTVAQKLYLLSQLNMARPYREKGGELQEKIFHSSYLKDFLSNSRIHVPQIYRQTCVSASHNLYLQRRLATIAEMLTVAKESWKTCKNGLNDLTNEAAQKQAYQVLWGKGPTKEEYIRAVLQRIERDINNLEKESRQIVASHSPKGQEIAGLTRKWNFIMQDIATLADPQNPRIFSYQFIPDWYRTSAVLSEITTQINQLAPGGALNQERWRAIRSADLQKQSAPIFETGYKKLVYRHEAQDPAAGPSLEEISIDSIWSKIADKNGCMIDFIYFPAGGHTIFVAAGYNPVNGSKSFFIHDPMSFTVETLSLHEFEQCIQKKYQNAKGTNSMYTLKN